MSQNVDPAIKDVHSNMAETNAKVINNVQSAVKDIESNTAQKNANEVDSVEANLGEILHHIRRIGESEPDYEGAPYDFSNNNVPEDISEQEDDDNLPEDTSDKDDRDKDVSDDKDCIILKPGISFATKEMAIKASKKFLSKNFHPFIIASSGGGAFFYDLYRLSWCDIFKPLFSSNNIKPKKAYNLHKVDSQ